MRKHWTLGSRAAASTAHRARPLGQKAASTDPALQKIGGGKPLPWDPGGGPQPTGLRVPKRDSGLCKAGRKEAATKGQERCAEPTAREGCCKLRSWSAASSEPLVQNLSRHQELMTAQVEQQPSRGGTWCKQREIPPFPTTVQLLQRFPQSLPSTGKAAPICHQKQENIDSKRPLSIQIRLFPEELPQIYTVGSLLARGL